MTTGRPPGLYRDLVIAASLAAVFFSYYQFSSSHLCDTDPYYHIKFAEITRTQGVVKDFPWTQWSSWKDSFFDKEVLYHLYLTGFTFGDLLQGAKVSTVVLGIGIFTIFMLVLRLNGVRWPWLWWVLLISSGGYFIYRMNVARPQAFSVFILLLALHFLINERVFLVGLMSLVYSLSYTGHYQYVGLALGFVGVVYLMERRLPWKLFVAALVGMMLGWVVHPNFPHNVSGFYVQNIIVIFAHWAPGVNLNMGGELQPMSTRSLLGVCQATLIPLWLVFITALVKRPTVDTKTVFLFAASTLYLIMTLFTKRFAEYWIPVTGLFVAFYFSPLIRGWDPLRSVYRYLSEERPLIGGVLAAVLFPPSLIYAGYAAAADRVRRPERLSALAKLGGVLLFVGLGVGIGATFVHSHFDSYRQVRSCNETTYCASAQFVRDQIPRKTQVLTCDWDDGPHVFFYSPHHYYTVFLDPNFMYAWKPEVWKTWDRLTHAKDPDPRGTLTGFFKADYVYCTSDFGAFKNQLQRTPGMELIYPPDSATQAFRKCRERHECVPCSTRADCGVGSVCKHPGPPNDLKRDQPKRCEVDPHVFIFKVQ